ncbi:CHAT domain-containing protein [Salinispora arenicola]|uniref:CHAT domain-containing protein n=1 Tax=Salinispora arenicola TaxID=168697 RepID=UPI000362A160|nr:CHAT domain-containing protein [Salinispora arenicola]MCN0178348.1 CHAT domain-containing protein [Salinispora arenicola]NIL58046.1 CHAT domain-containing protein [Salinispora arenicola]NIL60474.1 CHAT domain-containing protein [Salinispora arenicola]
MGGADHVDDSPAGKALRVVTDDPARATEMAEAALAAARASDDPAEETLALRALGLAALEQHNAEQALRHLRQACRVAEAARLPVRAAEARMSLALALAEAGQPQQALREIDAASPALHGLPRARLQMQRALILDRLGHFDEAMAGYTDALAVFRRGQDRLWQSRALTNRGVLHTYRGSLRQAEADLRAAEQGHAELGQELALAQVRHNLGFVLSRAGDIPGALRWYDLADQYFARTTRPAVALMDRGELLLGARLLPEARAAAEAALDAARASRMGLYEAQARLMLAEVALAEVDLPTATKQAQAAYRLFSRQNRPAWAALSRYVKLRASSPDEPAHLRQARSVARALSASSWPIPALDARLYAARVALDRALRTGQRAKAAAVAGELSAIRAASRGGPAQLRARAWHAEALRRIATGDTAGARRALNAGMVLLDRYQAALGATELRVMAGAYALELASTGLRLAVHGGQARAILRWSERWRAAALRLPPARPPDEAGLAADLTELRRTADEATRPGTASGITLLRRQRAIEERIRARSWQASGTESGTASGISPDQVAVELGDQTLVELIDVDGTLHTVVVHRGRFHTRAIGALATITAELQALRFALRRILTRLGTDDSQAAAATAAKYAVQQLDAILFGSIRSWLGDGGLVLVPVGALHAMPWALLPTCAGRPVTVVPSMSEWLTASARRQPTPSTTTGSPHQRHPVLVAGPGLAFAEAEVQRLAGTLAPAEVLLGPAATAEAALQALDGAPLAHLAAHGTFRSDNPMFSHVRLADGPLTVYDLERLARAPGTVVLSACDVGLSAVHPGEELMGLSAALLQLGTATVMASVLPALDSAAQELMVEMHRRLATGATPGRALAGAQAEFGGGLDAGTATAASFVCFGAG